VYLAARHNCRVATLKYLVTECGGVLNCVDNVSLLKILKDSILSITTNMFTSYSSMNIPH